MDLDQEGGREGGGGGREEGGRGSEGVREGEGGREWVGGSGWEGQGINSTEGTGTRPLTLSSSSPIAGALGVSAFSLVQALVMLSSGM